MGGAVAAQSRTAYSKEQRGSYLSHSACW